MSAYLRELEDRSIAIIRETWASFEKPALLWSVGKDSSVLLWLIRKAFLGKVPIPCVHVDTRYKLSEMIAFRDHLASQWQLDLVTSPPSPEFLEGNTYPTGKLSRVECCNALKSEPLKGLVASHGWDALILGIRRDEEGTRAKERVFSPRDSESRWNPSDQPVEIWGHYTRPPNGHMRVHPLLDWTELDVWRYIHLESIPVVDLYFSKDGKRYRSLGCAPCTFPHDSNAQTVPEIISELEALRSSERHGRAQDKERESAFEELRNRGYM